MIGASNSTCSCLKEEIKWIIVFLSHFFHDCFPSQMI
jgi:hypothetical protein